jgi:hypothetical protein
LEVHRFICFPAALKASTPQITLYESQWENLDRCSITTLRQLPDSGDFEAQKVKQFSPVLLTKSWRVLVEQAPGAFSLHFVSNVELLQEL